jgi:hypothetical protein
MTHPSTIAAEAAREAMLAGEKGVDTSSLPALERAHQEAVEARQTASTEFFAARRVVREGLRVRLQPAHDAFVAARAAEEATATALANERRRLFPPGSSMRLSGYTQTLPEQRETSPYPDGRPIAPGTGSW